MSSKTVETLRTAVTANSIPAPFVVPTHVPSTTVWRGQWWPFVDLTLAIASAFAVYTAFTWSPTSPANTFLHSGALPYSVLFAVVHVLACKRLAFYAPQPVDAIVSEIKTVAKANALALAVVMAALYIMRSHVLTPAVLLLTGTLSAALLLTTREFRSASVQHSIAAGLLTRNVLIIGRGEIGLALAEHFRRDARFGYVVKGFLDDQEGHADVLGRFADVEDVIRSQFIDEIFIASSTDRELVKQLTLKAPSYGVNVGIVPDMFDGIGWNAPVDRIGHFPVMVLHRQQAYPLQRLLKRVIDVITSAVGLLLFAPLVLLIAFAIKLDSPGPVFYIDSRVGRKGQAFRCLKFRTMCSGADRQLHEIAHLNERSGGPLFKLSNDPRITRLGRLLRRYSLDELPQLVNVLFGDMSRVGPRPPTIREYREFRLEHLRKLDVVPGITGLWQVSARRDPSFDSYIRYDLEYIENWSLTLDLEILARTLIEILRGTGN